MLDRPRAPRRQRQAVATIVLASLILGLIHRGALAQPRPAPASLTSASAALPSASIPPAAPPAPSPIPEQIVWLTSGAIVRGQIVELVPNHHVTLQLATGELRTIHWEEIERSSFVTPAAPPSARAAVAAPSAAAPPASATTSPSGVHISIVAEDKNVWLEARPRFSDKDWNLVCRTPCDREVSTRDMSLRINGSGVRPSNSFYIERQVGRETLYARTGDDAMHTWGQRSLVGGLALGLAGGAAFGLGRVQDEDGVAVAGVISMAAGGLLIAVALPLLGLSKTTVRNAKGEQVGRSDLGWAW